MHRFLLCLYPLLSLCASKLITVQTSRGALQGFDHDFGSDTSQRFYGYGQMFLGIPFAKAPVGEKRFSLPEDICQYNDRGEVHNATFYRPKCWQRDISNNMSEDCLFLNVMTPNINGTYPVMVYIHGGAFATGSAYQYDWKGAVRNLVSRGVVVVTIQYRLSVMGFFTTFTEQFPPNRGMYDQILALRWVNDEIASFGGDPDRITIFGQSAGAASVSDLSLSPLARGLFHQLIMTSGSSLFEIETMEDPRGSIHKDRAKQICQINDTYWGYFDKDQDLLDCLTNAAPEDLVAFDMSDSKQWNVAIDGAFLPDYPENLAKSRPKYPALVGDVLEEYAAFMPGFITHDISNITSRSNQYFLQYAWPNFNETIAKNISDTMIAGYRNAVIPHDSDHLGWARLISDMNTGLVFSSKMISDVQWHRKVGNEDIWLFTFTHRSMLPFGVNIDGWIPVAHCAELPYLWFYADVWETYNASQADLAVAYYLSQLWTDFAKNGSLPYPKAGADMNYIEIGDTMSLKANWRQRADEVYNKQIPSYFGELPPLNMTVEAWAKLRTLGQRVVATWNSMQCSSGGLEDPPETTTKTSNVLSLLSVIQLISVFLF